MRGVYNLVTKMNPPLELVKMECTIDETIPYTEQENENNDSSFHNNGIAEVLQQIKMEWITEETTGQETDKNNKFASAIKQELECSIGDINDFRELSGKEYDHNNLVYQINQKTEKIKMEEYTTEDNICVGEINETYEQNDVLNQNKQRGEKLITCSKCNFRTKLRKEFKRHFRKKHERKTKNLKKNIKKQKHYPNKKEQTDNDGSLETHSAKHVEAQFVCSVCDYRTISKYRLKTHTAAIHLGEYKFHCPDCEYKTNSKPKLTRHVVKHSGQYKFHCQDCKFTTRHKKELTRHVACHSDEYKFCCLECEYKTNYKQELRIHARKHCTECRYKTKHSASLKAHAANHPGNYKFHCAECDFKTNSNPSLKKHAAKHSGVYQFQCRDCDYTTNCEEEFTTHVANHFGGYKFRCAKCEYKTNEEDEFKSHVAVESLI